MPTTTSAPKLAATVMLADELAFHLMLEYLASAAPGFADYFITHTTRLIETGNMPAPTEEALSELRDHVVFCVRGGQ
jgi:hypothetical protein